MALKNRDVAHRAWNLLRLSLLWARKGGVLRRRLVMELRLVPKYLKHLGHTTPQSSQIHYFERELSFDKTPIFHVKMYRPSYMRCHLPHIPCINPHVDFEYDFDDDDDDDNVVEYDNGRKSNALMGKGDLPDGECYHGYVGCQETEEQEQNEDEEGIDKRAEEFIAKFYHQMKLQRQISSLHYNGTPNRSDIAN